MASHQVRRLPVVNDDNTLVGVVAQADVAFEAKEKAVGEMVEDISKTPTGPRVGRTRVLRERLAVAVTLACSDGVSRAATQVLCGTACVRRVAVGSVWNRSRRVANRFECQCSECA